MRFLSAFTAVALVAFTGCGKKSNTPEIKPVVGVKVSGKVVQGGSPIKFVKDETIKITFLSDVPKGQEAIVAQTEVGKEGGAFTINGPTGQGIPAGKYKVILSGEIYPPPGDGPADRFADKFDADKTPLNAEVTAEEGQVFTVDITSRKLTKGK